MTLLDHLPDCAIGSGAQVCTCGAISRMAAEVLADAPYIHPKAHVDGSVRLGARTKVWQFASVIRGAVLGADCSVGAGACLDGPILGDRCIVSPGVDIGPGFRIGNGVFLGPHVVLCNDAWPRADKDGFDMEALQSGRFVSVIVEDGASLGAHAVVMPGVRIGAGAMVAANATVTKDVPAGHLWTRDGAVVEIRPEWTKRRMRAA